MHRCFCNQTVNIDFSIIKKLMFGRERKKKRSGEALWQQPICALRPVENDAMRANNSGSKAERRKNMDELDSFCLVAEIQEIEICFSVHMFNSRSMPASTAIDDSHNLRKL